MSSRHKKLPVAVLERIDDACLEFENAWQAGRPMEIEALLTKTESPAERDALLTELLALDVDYRRKRGEEAQSGVYRERFPDDAGVVERAIHDCQDATRPGRFELPTTEDLEKRFPGLEIVELLGAGGMGAVYKARQKSLDRMVAIKILPDEIGHNVKFALRFTREARALARLNHPHIVAVYEFGSTEGTYYFLMEYVDGSNLREVIQAGLLSPKQALEIVPHLCDALQYAHDQGVVHRDIKPENILLDKSGQAKIADFGLSRLLGNESNDQTLTGSHQVMGTPRYMAPEQMQGAHQVDHRADIYSLGVVFYEMLTGELPMGHFAVPSKKVHIDVRLDDVVLKTLEKEPQRRYQHASDIKCDVEAIAKADDQSLAEESDFKTNGPRIDHQERLEKQELAARLLLLRRQMMSRVEQSLRPLFWGQMIQMLIGIFFVAVGVFCWTRNTDVPHRLVSGALIHFYGASMIIFAGFTSVKIGRIDYAKPVDLVRDQIAGIRSLYLKAGAFLGLSWWLLWIPFFVVLGFDAVAYLPSLRVSLGIGVVGLAISVYAYLKVLRTESLSAETWNRALAGESLRRAFLELDDIARTEDQ